MYDESLKGSIEHIETFMKAFGLEESEVGMVLAPRYDEDKSSIALDYFVKGHDDDFKPALDAALYPEVSDLEVKQKVYAEWVEAVERNFEEAEIYAADPEELVSKPAKAD